MIIDGKQIAAEIYEGLKPRIAALSFTPILCDIVVGANPVSLSYVGIKKKMAEFCNLEFLEINLPQNSTVLEIEKTVRDVQSKLNLCGLIVQLPLPKNIPTSDVLNKINLELDVDVLSDASKQQFYSGKSFLIPPTAAAIWHMLQTLNLNYSNKKFLVIGQGELVGRPISYLLKNLGFDVWVADEHTVNIKDLLASSDVIISAAGKPNLFSSSDVKSAVVIIDAGTSESNGVITGDSDFDSLRHTASFISPVPGGVGPVTVAKLIQNVVMVAESKI